MKYNYLFKPLKVNNLMLSNRIIASPMGIVSSEGMISSTNYGGLSLYDKSLGGAGLIVVNGDNDDPKNGMFSKYQREVTREMISVVKQGGAKIAAEVSCNGKKRADGYCYGPITGLRFDGAKMKEMSIEDMNAYKKRLASHCKNVKDFGFDMIFLCFSCDSLCSQFISPYFNTRTDEYGGSLENRVRFPVEMVTEIRKAVGKDYPLQIQVSKSLNCPETYKQEDILYFLKKIENEIDMVNITNGMDTYGGTYNNYIPNVHSVTTGLFPHLYGIDFAEKVKKAISKPVSLVGAVSDPKEADDAIKDGKLDAVQIGRQLVADPFMPKKARENRDEDIVPCIRCLNCFCYTTEHNNVVCSVNPRFKRENRVPLEISEAKYKKKVAIIGGGPAGCKAAITAYDRGHEVVLIEKNNKLGGQINCSEYSVLKQDLKRYRDYLANQVNKRGIDLRLNTVATPELIESLNVDALIIAVGSIANVPPIQGIENKSVKKIMDIYNEKKELTGNVVIIGAGQSGCELAIEASNTCESVTLIEGRHEIAGNSNMGYKISLNLFIKDKNNINVMTDTNCLEIKDNCVIVDNKYQGRKELKADTVIIATGFKPNMIEKEKFYGIVPETYEVGDCEKVATVCEATNFAYFIASNI